ncbi:lipopolysaccharide-induced tumor necrosis factor-alpha factor homolog [Schistocerca cancellata]|uniref:lipopolysaccharide-induced tumor necrosis factor-alpha factor homolog n=1 Tax=Schistocerca cancellata TaxID=274614 RepID=UPI002118ECE2|nr:lipopolysaccharide-induced tumor necrosis factor-alpha factor homolog [Schistocerca cancellata]
MYSSAEDHQPQPQPLHGALPPAYGVGGPYSSSPHTAVVFTTASVAVPAPAVGPGPSLVLCPTCGRHVQSDVTVKASTRTHLIAILLCTVGCWLCCCIPYCVDSCQAKNHYCPYCKTFLGTYD